MSTFGRIDGTRKVILEDNRKEIMKKRKAFAKRCLKIAILVIATAILVALIACAILAMINATQLVYQKDKGLVSYYQFVPESFFFLNLALWCIKIKSDFFKVRFFSL